MATAQQADFDRVPILRIAMLAPPWIPVPAPAYGGIEEVVRVLCRGLVERGHDVTLLAPPGSRSSADVVPLLDEPHPEDIELSLVEANHVSAAFDLIKDARANGRPFDVLHDHCPGVAVAMADSLDVPVVHTLHGPFDEHRAELYRRHGHKATLVAISEAQRAEAPEGVACDWVIPNPIDLDEWPFSEDKDDALLFMGRMDPDKGPDRAIAAAQAAGSRLILAGPVQPDHTEFFDAEVAPHLDDEQTCYVGAVGGAQRTRLFARSRGLLMPIDWPEPFGLVMVEALACGTPVIAFDQGSASEIIDHGKTGYLVRDVEQMAQAIGELDRIAPAACRASVERRFGLPHVVASYEQVYAVACRDRSTRAILPSSPSTSSTTGPKPLSDHAL
jgi:glycosyltransferase involved in cell wall biosynthesis